MENKIIIPNINEVTDPLTIEEMEETKKEIDMLNAQLTDKTGEWRYVEGQGIGWFPLGDQMGGTLKQPVPSAPCQLLRELVDMGKAIDLENVPEKSVLVVKINTDNPIHAQTMQQGIVRQILEPRFKLLKEKKITVLFMSSMDDLTVITEQDMERAGWYKKEPSRIITL